jgi:hypothetical protein
MREKKSHCWNNFKIQSKNSTLPLKTLLTRLPFIQVPAQRQESDGNVYVC